MKAILLAFALSFLINFGLAQVQLRVIRQWKFLNYTWPDATALQNAMLQGSYVPENVVASGIMYHDGWYYLTMPRMKAGVPATLGRITAETGGSTAPLIEPYPSWDDNREGDCNSLQNVQNVEVDKTGTMWIIDGGHVHSLSQNPVKSCPPKLVIHDVRNNRHQLTYVFPESVASKTDSFLYDLVIDDEIYCYITDNSARDPGIIVYSRKANRAWKLRHPESMKADPTAQNFRLNGVPVDAAINIAGIALGPKVKSHDSLVTINMEREVYYSPLSSLQLYSIGTSVLQDENNAAKDFTVKLVGRKGSQTDGMIMTSKGVLYYGLLSENAIAYWDSHKPFNSKVISKDPTYIQWTNSFTIDDRGNLTVLTDTLQRFIHGNLDIKKYNFWLLSASINESSYLYEDPFYEYVPIKQNATKENVPDSGSRLLLQISTILFAIFVVSAL